MRERGKTEYYLFFSDLIVLLALFGVFFLFYPTNIKLVPFLLIIFIGSWFLTGRLNYFFFDYYSHVFMTGFWTFFFSCGFLMATHSIQASWFFLPLLFFWIILVAAYRHAFYRLKWPFHILAYNKLKDKALKKDLINYHFF